MRQFFRLALSLCVQDLQERFAGSLLGSLWVFIWPLMQLFIYIVIFGKLMGARLGGNAQIYSYGMYVAAGLLSWTCFSGTLQRTAKIFVDKRQIITKVWVDLRVFPLFICMVELLPFAAATVLLFIVDLFSGWTPSIGLLFCLLFALYCQQLLATGLGLFFACFAIFARDVTEAVAIALQMAFWFTPIVYMPSILPEWLATALNINPMTHIVGIFQQTFVFDNSVSWESMVYLAVISHIALALGLYTLRHLQKDIRDAL